jgi:hypothetical protein
VEVWGGPAGPGRPPPSGVWWWWWCVNLKPTQSDLNGPQYGRDVSVEQERTLTGAYSHPDKPAHLEHLPVGRELVGDTVTIGDKIYKFPTGKSVEILSAAWLTLRTPFLRPSRRQGPPKINSSHSHGLLIPLSQ